MKIIKAGEIPQKREYTVSCRSCGTIFSFLAEEATLHSSQRDGAFFKINCPLRDCGSTVYLNKPSAYSDKCTQQ